MELKPVPYTVDDAQLTGYLADGSGGRAAPGILVAHEGGGLSDHAKRKASRLADLGYVAFALDMYGKTATTPEEAAPLFQGMMADGGALRRRALAGLDVLRKAPNVDPNRLGAIGFCFGGIVAMELARADAPIRCAIGFHPSFKRPSPSPDGPISARVLMIIGDADPIVPEADRAAFAAEMKAVGADWQLHVFGGVGHSFTNPAVDALNFPGFAYDAIADRRSWAVMLNMLEEVF